MNNMESNQSCRKTRGSYPLTAAVLLAVSSSVAYILMRRNNNKVYSEKWKEYDECGI